jgi:hypothetical protein
VSTRRTRPDEDGDGVQGAGEPAGPAGLMGLVSGSETGPPPELGVGDMVEVVEATEEGMVIGPW